MVGVGYTSREFCDGQSLASPGRWPVQQRQHPGSNQWKAVSGLFMGYAEKHAATQLLMSLALGLVERCPFGAHSVRELKESTIEAQETHGLELRRDATDRRDLPIDFRYLGLLLRAAGDPEVHLGPFAKGVRVGVGVRLRKLPALYTQKKKWRLPEQTDSLDYQEGEVEHRANLENYITLVEFTVQVLEVMEDKAERGQILKYTEQEGRERYPNLVVGSRGANRKDKPGELFQPGFCSMNRIRDQERAPKAADLKRALREKSEEEENTFALTAEAHRQVLIAPEDWHLLACQVQEGSTVYVNTVILSQWRPHRTTCQGSPLLSVASRSASQETTQALGTCLWLTTFVWKLGDRSVVQL